MSVRVAAHIPPIYTVTIIGLINCRKYTAFCLLISIPCHLLSTKVFSVGWTGPDRPTSKGGLPFPRGKRRRVPGDISVTGELDISVTGELD